MLQKKEHGRGDTCGMMDSDVHGFLEASFSLSPIDKQVKEEVLLELEKQAGQLNRGRL